ncbi:MAG: hypothetical protein H6573_25980 [Lewinellaceae bacterium]|nr:hypothetical protein [Lewinellaceae bacterium]
MNDFFANLFELWGINMTEISDSLYDYNLYSTIGGLMMVTCLMVFIIYYYIINSPDFNKKGHWLIVTALTGIFVAIVSLIILNKKFTFEELGYLFGDYIQFTLTVLFFTMATFFVFSLLGKHWSTNCKDTPIRTRR